MENNYDFKRTGFIYSWVNLINGKRYIGKWEGDLTSLYKRYRKEIKDEKIKNRAILNAIRHHGIEKFRLEILEYPECVSMLNDLEVHYIATLRSKTTEHGYNCTSGGEGGDTFTFKTKEAQDVTRRKIGEKSKNQIWTEERRKNASDLWKGRPIPQWQRDMIANSLRGNKRADGVNEKQSKTMKSMDLWNKIKFTEEQICFVMKHKQMGRRRIQKLFNEKFGTNYSDAPFLRLKRTL